MTEHYFFGYGSLVNQRTHSYPDPRPATLRGWRRIWRPTALQNEAFLSAHRVDGGAIHGLLAAVPGRDWRALDLRESGYERHQVSGDVDHDLSGPADVQVYAVADATHRPDLPGAVLLSYLDVVVQGFVHHYGTDGAVHFFDTTDGWPAMVIDDRAAPLYPRHQSLTARERALVDEHLAALPVTVEKLE